MNRFIVLIIAAIAAMVTTQVAYSFDAFQRAHMSEKQYADYQRRVEAGKQRRARQLNAVGQSLREAEPAAVQRLSTPSFAGSYDYTMPGDEDIANIPFYKTSPLYPAGRALYGPKYEEGMQKRDARLKRQLRGAGENIQAGAQAVATGAKKGYESARERLSMKPRVERSEEEAAFMGGARRFKPETEQAIRTARFKAYEEGLPGSSPRTPRSAEEMAAMEGASTTPMQTEAQAREGRYTAYEQGLPAAPTSSVSTPSASTPPAATPSWYNRAGSWFGSIPTYVSDKYNQYIQGQKAQNEKEMLERQALEKEVVKRQRAFPKVRNYEEAYREEYPTFKHRASKFFAPSPLTREEMYERAYREPSSWRFSRPMTRSQEYEKAYASQYPQPSMWQRAGSAVSPYLQRPSMPASAQPYWESIKSAPGKAWSGINSATGNLYRNYLGEE